MLAQFWALQCLLLGAALAGVIDLLPRQSDTNSNVDDSCGVIFDYVFQGYSIFRASAVYDCLISVPFNTAVGLRYIDYLNETWQYQSDLAYLKAPPTGYQQPAVDVPSELQRIRSNVDKVAYKNEYAFELDIQRLVFSVHDAHFDLYAGIIAPFTFASPVDIVSVSADGKSAPVIYLQDDVIASRSQAWTPSRVTQINGIDVIQYLTDIALRESFGNLDANSDWNQLMGSPALDIQGASALFTGGSTGLTFYPGADLNFTFANGSKLETIYIAYYTNAFPTGPLTTGGDFYNYFVLNQLPAACDGSDNQPTSCLDPFAATKTTDASTTSSTGLSGAIMSGLSGNAPSSTTSSSVTSTATTAAASWYNISSGAYPSDPFVAQDELTIAGAGVVTGYYLDNSTAVLSIPTFIQFGEGILNFSTTTADFIDTARENKVKRVIIDLQQNTGGAIVLAVTLFKQFFPSIDPFLASNRRDHPQEKILGNILTNWWDSLTEDEQLNEFYNLASEEWIVTNRINVETGRNFSSWPQFYGPRQAQGDLFSLPEQYNLSNILFDSAAFGFIPAGYVEDQADNTRTTNAFDPKDIIILTDGLCSSTCTLFVEMMTHQAGVRTVTVGGRPNTGPMQATGGTRGALAYSGDELDGDFELAESELIGNTTGNATLPQLEDGFRDSGVFQLYTGFNLRNQLRPKDMTPLQFKYLAAECRIYFTLANVYNFTRLWHDAANAIWSDNSLCVQGSLGYAASANGTASKAPPAAPNLQTSASSKGLIPFNDGKALIIQGNGSGKEDAPRRSVLKPSANKAAKDPLRQCKSSNDCGGSACLSAAVTCHGSNPNALKSYVNVFACLLPCRGPDFKCPQNFECGNLVALNTKSLVTSSNAAQSQGNCFPTDNFQSSSVCPA